MPNLTIANIKQETKDAVSLLFEVPEAQQKAMQWIPGQHLQLRCMIAGKPHVRRYSIASGDTNHLAVTVKKIEGGLVSSFICDEVKAGDGLAVSKPQGLFQLQPDAERSVHHCFLAAGSGITPIYSMLVGVLNQEPKSKVSLLYGNRAPEDIIFASELAQLQQCCNERFEVKHCLSGETGEAWHRGRINASAINRFVSEMADSCGNLRFYCCGPGNFIETSRETLKTMVPEDHISDESFL